MHAHCLHRKVAGARVAAVSDVDAREGREGRGGVRRGAVFGDAVEMIRDEGGRGRRHSLPRPTHAGLVHECLRLGKPVLCEKPLATSPEEALGIVEAEVEAAASSCRSALCAASTRSTWTSRTWPSRAPSGSPCSSRGGTGTPDTPGADSEWVVINAAIHDLDSARWMLEAEVEEVFVRGLNTTGSAEGEFDLQLIQLTFADGRLATIEVNVDARFGYEVGVEVVGVNGTAHTARRRVPWCAWTRRSPRGWTATGSRGSSRPTPSSCRSGSGPSRAAARQHRTPGTATPRSWSPRLASRPSLREPRGRGRAGRSPALYAEGRVGGNPLSASGRIAGRRSRGGSSRSRTGATRCPRPRPRGGGLARPRRRRGRARGPAAPDPSEVSELLDGYGLGLVGGFVPAVLHEPDRRGEELALVEAAGRVLRRGRGRRVVLAAMSGSDDFGPFVELDDGAWRELFESLEIGRGGLRPARHGGLAAPPLRDRRRGRRAGQALPGGLRDGPLPGHGAPLHRGERPRRDRRDRRPGSTTSTSRTWTWNWPADSPPGSSASRRPRGRTLSGLWARATWTSARSWRGSRARATRGGTC